MESVPAWGWLVFGVLLITMLAIDLGVHRGAHHNSMRSAVLWSVIWIALGLAFTGFVWRVMGAAAGKAYLAAYLIEKSLSLDNLFVFLLIFHSLQIPADYQRTALFWGILGALVFRAIFIVLGAAALERWHWIEYVFGALLLYAAYHTWRKDPAQQEESQVVAWLGRHFPVGRDRHTSRFIQRDAGRRVLTPLFIAVLGLEITDILFAVDSVPAALSVSRSTFVVYSSNVFAILGLRSLYLVLAQTLSKLRYLHYGLAAVLAFAGFKMLVNRWIDIPSLLSVGIILVCIGMAGWLSLRVAKKGERESFT